MEIEVITFAQCHETEGEATDRARIHVSLPDRIKVSSHVIYRNANFVCSLKNTGL